MRVTLSVIGTLLLASCSTLPKYNETLYKDLDDANSQLTKIDAALDVIQTSPPPYSSFETYYTSAIADLTRAKALATDRDKFYAGKLPSQASGTISDNIDLCLRQVKAQMILHKASGINHQTISDSTILKLCSLPEIMEKRLNNTGKGQ